MITGFQNWEKKRKRNVVFKVGPFELLTFISLWLPVAVSTIERRCLVGEPEGAHPRLRDASTALPGAADGKANAAVSQPAAVTLVVLLETPGGIKMADQGQPSSLTVTRFLRLLEGERPRDEEDGACGGRTRTLTQNTVLVECWKFENECWECLDFNRKIWLAHLANLRWTVFSIDLKIKLKEEHKNSTEGFSQRIARFHCTTELVKSFVIKHWKKTYEKVNTQIFRKQDQMPKGVESLGSNRMSERWSRRHQSGLASCLSLHSCGCRRATPPHRQAVVGWLDSGRCHRGATRHCTSPVPLSRLWERTHHQFTQIIRKLFC